MMQGTYSTRGHPSPYHRAPGRARSAQDGLGAALTRPTRRFVTSTDQEDTEGPEPIASSPLGAGCPGITVLVHHEPLRAAGTRPSEKWAATDLKGSESFDNSGEIDFHFIVPVRIRLTRVRKVLRQKIELTG
jgi:hypothetical protein